MNVFVDTLGCRLNEAEAAAWQRAFSRAGYRVVSAACHAEIVVLNTCAVTHEAVRKSRKLASRLHREQPQAKLVLTGCFSELEPFAAASLAGVDLLVKNGDKDALVREIESRFPERAPRNRPTAPPTETPPPRRRTRAFIKIQDGCRHACTYCVVTRARGQERSRPIGAILREINTLHGQGYQDVVLTGVHLGGYGQDLNTNLATLLAQILAETAIPRLRLSSLEPWDIAPEIWPLWRNPRFAPHLHLPLQSGADAILQRMGRRCSLAQFEQIVATARAAIPELLLSTDIIVGFPGETARQFDASCQAVRAFRFAQVHAFCFSPRTGTPAATMPDQLAASTKRDRLHRLQRVAAETRAQVIAPLLGTTHPVLWERSTPAGASCRCTGFTNSYLRCKTVVPRAQDPHNQIRPARLIADHGSWVEAVLEAERP